MRSRLAVAVVVTLATAATAGAQVPPAAPPTVPMTAVTDAAAACAAMRDGASAPPCRRVATGAVKGLGKVEVWAVRDRDRARYAAVVTIGARRWSSPTVELEVAGCAAGQCTIADRQTPRVIAMTTAAGPLLALSLDVAWHGEQRDGARPRVTARWHQHVLVVCGAIGGGDPTCVETRDGDRDRSCTASVGGDGVVTSTCVTRALAPLPTAADSLRVERCCAALGDAANTAPLDQKPQYLQAAAVCPGLRTAPFAAAATQLRGILRGAAMPGACQA